MPSGYPHYKCLKEDYNEISNLSKKLNPNSQAPCVRECRRIGKYDVSKTHPHSILVMLKSAVEVANVLSKHVDPPPLLWHSRLNSHQLNARLRPHCSKRGVNWLKMVKIGDLSNAHSFFTPQQKASWVCDEFFLTTLSYSCWVYSKSRATPQ